ncbi:RTA1-domain-containing protein [Thozetella sp. PMI_491]|nr:RTA1-domain-containing protein [Thozetella sp. PMI_491]
MPSLQPLEGTSYYLWFYVPQLWASLLFLVFFTVLSALHAWRMAKTRTWFCIPFLVGGIFELLGYALRANAYNNTGKIMPYAFYAMATLLAPALFAASIYMTLGRLVCAVRAQSLLIIPEKWLTGLFVSGDVASFLVQGGGCGLMVMRDLRLVQIGEKVVVAGLAIQIIMFGLFGITAMVTQTRLRRSIAAQIDLKGSHWEQGFFMLYGVSLLIVVRSIFRLVEFIQGRAGYLLRTEWPALVFDATLMFLTMVVFLAWHPARWSQTAPSLTLVVSAENGKSRGC